MLFICRTYIIKDFVKLIILIKIKFLIIKIISREIKYKNEDIKTSFFTLKTLDFNVH